MPPVSRLYLDTNIFILLFESGGNESSFLSALIKRRQKTIPSSFVTSELTHSELLVKPFREKNERLMRIYEHWTISNPILEVIPVSRSILNMAALLRADYASIKLPDAIHLATAMNTGCRFVLSADERLKGFYTLNSMLNAESSQEIPSLSILRPGPDILTSLMQEDV